MKDQQTLVFELINRAGRSLERHKLQGDNITIGRAYDNDLILSDETVSPHHASITCDDDGHIIIKDLGSVNGIRNEKHEKLEGVFVLRSGNEYLFGKTRMRIFTIDHPVTDTLSLSHLDWAISYSANNWLTFGALLVLSLLMIVETWMDMTIEFKWENYIYPVFVILAITIFTTLFWGLIGRIVKHEMRLKAHFTVISVYLVIAIMSVHVYEFLLFNSLNYILTVSIYLIIAILLLTILFWFNLHIATYQSNAQRWKLASFLSVSIIILSIFSDLVDRTNFSLDPRYIAEMKPPVLRIVAARDIAQFIQDGSVIFDHK